MRTKIINSCLFLLIVSPCVVHADENAALQYWLAFAELDADLPDYVSYATTDSKVFGFPNALSDQQRNFLEREDVCRMDYRFQKATSISLCDWKRDPSADGFAIHTNVIGQKAHHLASVALLFARREYENKRWKEGHKYILSTYRLSHDVATQIRAGENFCYMICNMARGTACTYLLDMPVNERDVLAQQIRQLPPLLPMRDAYLRDAKLSKWLSHSLTAVSKKSDASSKDVVSLLQAVVSRPEAKDLQNQYSVKELQIQADELSHIQTRIADLMRQPIVKSDQTHRQEILPQVAQNPMARLVIGDDASNWLRREDAQSECRRAMFFAAIDYLQNGTSGLTQHKDPFGISAFSFNKEENGFVLISQLRYGSFSPETETWDHRIVLAVGRTASHALVK